MSGVYGQILGQIYHGLTGQALKPALIDKNNEADFSTSLEAKQHKLVIRACGTDNGVFWGGGHGEIMASVSTYQKVDPQEKNSLFLPIHSVQVSLPEGPDHCFQVTKDSLTNKIFSSLAVQTSSDGRIACIFSQGQANEKGESVPDRSQHFIATVSPDLSVVWEGATTDIFQSMGLAPETTLFEGGLELKVPASQQDGLARLFRSSVPLQGLRICFPRAHPGNISDPVQALKLMSHYSLQLMDSTGQSPPHSRRLYFTPKIFVDFIRSMGT